MRNENDGDKDKIMIGGFNCTVDIMDRDGGNKTQRIYRCCFNYAMSKIIADNGLMDLWGKESPDSSEFTR